MVDCAFVDWTFPDWVPVWKRENARTIPIATATTAQPPRMYQAVFDLEPLSLSWAGPNSCPQNRQTCAAPLTLSSHRGQVLRTSVSGIGSPAYVPDATIQLAYNLHNQSADRTLHQFMSGQEFGWLRRNNTKSP